jgi:hypothetical protein
MVLRKAFLILSIASITGCANNTVLFNPPPQKMGFDELNYYKVDCKHAREQTAFLKTQLTYISRFDVNSMEGAIIHNLLFHLEEDCSPEDQVQLVQQSCLHVREDMNSGSANATVCKAVTSESRNDDTLIINHWDAMVDTK